LTSLVDVPAEVIAAMYSLRWSIELFFRWLKHLLGCRHLISEKPQGVAIQIYCALIACLLLAQITGDSVGRRAFNLVCLYLQGWADADELAEGLARIRASQKPRKNR
jgi:IS4 transposase